MRMTAENFPNDRDQQLLAAVALGERRALEELYLGYYRRLSRFLTRFSARYETIEEIINDTFMVVWQHAGDFRGASRVSTWIIGIAYRTALKSLRREDPRGGDSTGYAEASVDPTREAELRDWVSQGLAQLPLEQRMVLELAYHMGHSIEEIAAITEAPVGTVKARMFHAREKLRQYLPALAGSDSSSSYSGLTQ
jgi:RNA polymerase sigma-70 factor, ECF subfamily